MLTPTTKGGALEVLPGWHRVRSRYAALPVAQGAGEGETVISREQFAKLMEGFCPFTHKDDDGRLRLGRDGWLVCSHGIEWEPVQLVEAIPT